jgi:hypothetical protein
MKGGSAFLNAAPALFPLLMLIRAVVTGKIFAGVSDAVRSRHPAQFYTAATVWFVMLIIFSLPLVGL